MKRFNIKLFFEEIRESFLDAAILLIIIYLIKDKYRIWAIITSLLFLCFKHRSLKVLIFLLLFLLPSFSFYKSNIEKVRIIQKKETSYIVENTFFKRMIIKQKCSLPLGARLIIKVKEIGHEEANFLQLPLQKQIPIIAIKEQKVINEKGTLLEFLNDFIKQNINVEKQKIWQAILLSYPISSYTYSFTYVGFITLLSFLLRYRISIKKRKYLEILLAMIIYYFLPQKILFFFLCKRILSLIKWRKDEYLATLICTSFLFLKASFYSLTIILSLFHSSIYLWQLKLKEIFLLRSLISMFLFGKWQVIYSLGYRFFRISQGILCLLAYLFVLFKINGIAYLMDCYIKGESYLHSLQIGYSFNTYFWLLYLIIYLFINQQKRFFYFVFLSLFIFIYPFFYHHFMVIYQQGNIICIYHEKERVTVFHQGQNVEYLLAKYRQKYPFRKIKLENYSDKTYRFNLSNVSLSIKGKDSSHRLAKTDILLTNDQFRKVNQLLDECQAKFLIYARQKLDILQYKYLVDNHISFLSLQEEGGLLWKFYFFKWYMITAKGNFVIIKK